MSYFAQFQRHEGQLFRLNTRIYLQDVNCPTRIDVCVAAFIAKNPGSAKPTVLGKHTRLQLDGDKLLPTVRNRFLDAYRESGIPIPIGAFIRVWNLLYLCNPVLSQALSAYQLIRKPLCCPTERRVPRIVWFAWGPPNPRLTSYQQRFLQHDYAAPFYYDMDTRGVVAARPDTTSRVKHTQGMPAEPILAHLVSLLGGQ